MRPDDRDILFGDRFGGYYGPSGDLGGSGVWAPDDGEVDALMDAYFDGDIAADDRIRLFELLRRDADRCLQFVEMQRTTLLLERAAAGPDQTEVILARVGRQHPRQRFSPRITRFAVAAAVLLAGAGLVIIGQSGPPTAPGSPSMPASLPGEVASAPQEPAARPAGETRAAPARRALQPGPLRSTGADLLRDPGQPEAQIHGLAGISHSGSGASLMPPHRMDPPAAVGTHIRELEALGASPSDIRRLMGFAYGGHTPWGIVGMWPDLDDSWTKPKPAPRPAIAEP